LNTPFEQGDALPGPVPRVFTCTSCQQPKGPQEMQTSRSTQRGFLLRCRACCTSASKRSRSKKESRHVEVHKAWYRRKYVERRVDYLVSAIRNRAKQNGLAFDLDQWRPQLRERMAVGRCELSDLPFTLEQLRAPCSPSIDRISPSAGYVYTNVRLICWCLNAAFGAWGEVQTREVMIAWLQHQPKESST
jgi:hypothetical protein